MGISVHHVIVAIVVFVTWCPDLSQAFNRMTYRLNTDASGNPACSVDPPSKVVMLDINDLANQCGVECNRQSCCLYWQFKADLMQCELYDWLPGNFTTINQCTGYQVSNVSKYGHFLY